MTPGTRTDTPCRITDTNNAPKLSDEKSPAKNARLDNWHTTHKDALNKEISPFSRAENASGFPQNEKNSYSNVK
jgi:hypothetical protein